MRPLTWDDWIAFRLDRLERQGLTRTLRPVDRLEPRLVLRDGRELVNFSSNDYLGLSRHPAVLAGAERELRRGGGATASRLMAGTDHDVVALEAALAHFKGTEAALVFGSGYLANVGTIPALVGRGDDVFSDRLNHASIVDGIRLSGARLHRYRHNDPADLEARLAAGSEAGGRKLIVTETLFGMDGDLAPLAEIVALKRRFGAALMVDEAHATGVLGPGGRGLAHQLGLASDVDVHMGTFSKAFGLYGGYVATRSRWARYLLQQARSFVFTTALPPAVVGGVGAALELVLGADAERRRLHRLANRARQGMAQLGLDAGEAVCQILPVGVGDAAEAMRAGEELAGRGILAVPVRPPTVPRGRSRLRFSITAAHTEEDVDRALDALARVGLEAARAG